MKRGGGGVTRNLRNPLPPNVNHERRTGTVDVNELGTFHLVTTNAPGGFTLR